jgi:hypothetical protein
MEWSNGVILRPALLRAVDFQRNFTAGRDAAGGLRLCGGAAGGGWSNRASGFGDASFVFFRARRHVIPRRDVHIPIVCGHVAEWLRAVG